MPIVNIADYQGNALQSTNGALNVTFGPQTNNNPVSVGGGLLGTPSNLSVSVVGQAGSVSHAYSVVASGPEGDSVPSASISVLTPNNTGQPNSSNYVKVTWTGVVGATGYKVLKDGQVISGANPLPAGTTQWLENAVLTGSGYVAATTNPISPVPVSNDQTTALYIYPPTVTPINRLNITLPSLTATITATDYTTGSGSLSCGGFTELDIDMVFGDGVTGITYTALTEFDLIIERQSSNTTQTPWMTLFVIQPQFGLGNSSSANGVIFQLAVTISASTPSDYAASASFPIEPIKVPFTAKPGVSPAQNYATLGLRAGLGGPLRVVWYVNGTAVSIPVNMGFRGK